MMINFFLLLLGEKRKYSNLSEKKLVLILFIEDLPGLICVNNFRPVPILTWNEHKQYKEPDTTNEKNTHKEELQCNEKDWNLKNILWTNATHTSHAKILTNTNFL